MVIRWLAVLALASVAACGFDKGRFDDRACNADLDCRPDEVLMVLLEKVGQPVGTDGAHPLVAVPDQVVAEAFEVVAAGAPAGR